MSRTPRVLPVLRTLSVPLALGIVAPAAAQAQDIETARRAYVEADFRTALALYERAVEETPTDRRAAAEAHAHLAALRAMFGEADDVDRHVDAAILLDPRVRVPEGAPLDVERQLEEARRRARGRAASLEIVLVSTARSDAGRTFEARLVHVPEAMALHVELACNAEGERPTVEHAPRSVRVEITAAEGPVECHARALGPEDVALFDAHRKFVGVARLDLSRHAAAPEGTGQPDDDGPSVWPWVGLAGGVTLTALVVIAVLAGGSEEDPTFNETVVEGW